MINKYLTIYKNIPKPAKASLWLTVMTVFQKGISFLAIPIYTRLLTPSDYGYYSIYLSWFYILCIFATLNLQAGVFNNGMLKWENDRKRYISSMQGLSSISTLIVFLIFLIGKNFFLKITGIDIVLLFCLFIALFFTPSFRYWSAYQRYNFEYRKLVCVTLIQAILIPVLGVILLFVLPQKKYGIILANVVGTVGVGLFFFIQNWKEGKHLFVKEYWKYALLFNLPLIPHYLADVVLEQVDRIMIQNMVGQDKAGIYSLSYTVSLMMNIVVTGINASFTPYTYKKIKANETKELSFYSNLILIFVGIVCLMGTLIAPELILFLGTKEYLEAQWVIPPVMLSVFFTMLYTLFANVEFYYEKPIYIMIASIIAAILNIILNYICIPKYSYIAAGYTTLICYVIFALAHFFFMSQTCKKNDKRSPYNTIFIFIFSIGLTVISLSLLTVYQYPLIRYGLIIVLCVICSFFRKRFVKLLSVVKN